MIIGAYKKQDLYFAGFSGKVRDDFRLFLGNQQSSTKFISNQSDIRKE